MKAMDFISKKVSYMANTVWACSIHAQSMGVYLQSPNMGDCLKLVSSHRMAFCNYKNTKPFSHLQKKNCHQDLSLHDQATFLESEKIQNIVFQFQRNVFPHLHNFVLCMFRNNTEMLAIKFLPEGSSLYLLSGLCNFKLKNPDATLYIATTCRVSSPCGSLFVGANYSALSNS